MPCSRRMIQCHSSCLHRQSVTEYYAARHAAELAREAATGNYATELAEYGPILTFKDWLTRG